MVKESCLSTKECFKNICMQKRDMFLFKLHSKMSKKINKYTGLPDVKYLSSDIENWTWNVEFHDKKGLVVLCFGNDEFNKFDASLSITWYKGMNEMAKIASRSNRSLGEIVGVRIWLDIPVFVDFRTNNLIGSIGTRSNQQQQQRKNLVNINKANRILVIDQQLADNIFKSNSNELKSIAKNDTIELMELSKTSFLMGFWRSSNASVSVRFSLSSSS